MRSIGSRVPWRMANAFVGIVLIASGTGGAKGGQVLDACAFWWAQERL